MPTNPFQKGIRQPGRVSARPAGPKWQNMKKTLIVIGITAVLVTGAIALIFYLTSGVVKVAESFFSAIEAGDYTKAHNYLSEDFHAATPSEALKSFLEKNALINYSQASWGTRTISGSQGELEGTIATREGGTVPIKMTFVKEKGFWRIQSLWKSEAGVVRGDSRKTIPLDDELGQLANRSMHDLALAIHAKDFTNFYNNIARLWQSQTNKEDLSASFKSFTEQGIDLTILDSVNPIFNEKTFIDNDGFLVLQGYYPTTPSTAYFKLKYAYEYPDWKLVSIDVRIK